MISRLFLTLLFVLPLTGSFAQQNAVNDAVPSPPGRLVDIGGYRLHLHCIGQGSPTVILIHGFGDYSFHWLLVQPQVARVTRVCAYDRAGQTWSDPGPPPRGLETITKELHILLSRAGEKGPYLLVGQSWGGLIPRLYVKQHRNDVAGVVFVDASQEDMWMWINGTTLQPRLASPEEWAYVRAPRARHGPPAKHDSSVTEPTESPSQHPKTQLDTSLPPLASPFDRLPKNAQVWHRWAVGRIPAFTGGDWNDIRSDLIAVYESRGKATHPFGAIPVIVLTAGKNDFEDDKAASAATQREQFLRGQDQLTALSANSRQLFAASSGHRIHLEEPDLVVEAIRQVIESVRSHRPLCCQGRE